MAIGRRGGRRGVTARAAQRRVLAAFLSVLLALETPLQALAEGTAAPYISEVYVSVATTAADAARALEAGGWQVLTDDSGAPADLNAGAGSALKETRAVVLGYKTTQERSEALTDLAVMGMEGGYSFSAYKELMDRYRDSQIRPFIERFMVAVGEYRANASSADEAARGRAKYVRAMLNHVVDDDTGRGMGDLLLEQTKQEMGEAYDALPEGQRRSHVDLETALMQGNS